MWTSWRSLSSWLGLFERPRHDHGDVPTLIPPELGHCLERLLLLGLLWWQDDEQLSRRQSVGEGLIGRFLRQQTRWHEGDVVELHAWPAQRSWWMGEAEATHRV